MFCYSLLI